MGWRWRNVTASAGALATMESSVLLLRYGQAADPQLLAQLFLRYADALYHFLLRHSDADLAQDISQQAWLQLMKHADSYQGQSSVKTWLFSIARHLLIDELRRQRRQVSEPDAELPAGVTAQPLMQLLAAERAASLDQAIMQLPHLQREALMLQLEDFSLAQIAEITQSLPETVKTRLRYARQQLKQLTGAYDEQ